MDEKALLRALNWFLFLEKEQVELYKNQSRLVDDSKLARVLGKFADIEQGHVDKISQKIKELGGNPGELSQKAGAVVGEALKWVGSAAAHLTDLAGTANMLKLDILAERKAIDDYRALIEKVDETLIKDLLWSNMVEEDMHLKWMEAKVEELEAGEGS